MRWQLSSQEGVTGGLGCSHVLEVPAGPQRSLTAPLKGPGSREAADCSSPDPMTQSAQGLCRFLEEEQ